MADPSSSSYQEPSDLLKRLFLPPKNPSLTLSSDYQWLLFCQEPPLPSIDLLARPEEKLAGLRFDPIMLTPSRMEYALDLTAQHLASGERISIPLPPGSQGIRYISFNDNVDQRYSDADGGSQRNEKGRHLQEFVFTSKQANGQLEPFLCYLTRTGTDTDTDTDTASTGPTFQWTVQALPAPDIGRMTFCAGNAYQFTNDGKYLLTKVVPSGLKDVPPSSSSSSSPSAPSDTGVSTQTTIGPSIQAVAKDARKAPGRTYQDLLKNRHDENRFRYYLSSQVKRVDLETMEVVSLPQAEGDDGKGRILQRLQNSPCGRYVLADITTELSYAVPWGRFGKTIELWDLHQAMTRTTSITPVISIPVNDEIPLSFDACSRHPRGYTFHPCYPHTLMYVQAVDGGDPDQNEPSADGERDVVYTQNILPTNSSAETIVTSTVGEPQKLVGLAWRFDDIDFPEDNAFILISEYRWKDRMERLWKYQDGEKTLVWERNWQDRYSSPGAPMTKKGKNGQYFLRQKKENPNEIYLRGGGASPLGDRPFLDVRNLNSGETQRLWRCKAPKPKDGENDKDIFEPAKEVNGKIPDEGDRQDIYESLVLLLDDDDTILISRESKTTPRNYYLTKLSNLLQETTVTTFPHPQPDLLGVQKELVHYKRKDGVKLTADLYLPADYDGTPRPTLFWAYPEEFKDAQSAGQVSGSQHRFVSASWASPIHWAAKGWAVMDDFSLPVIGEGEAQPNDTFVEQIVAGATAAVEYATERGVTDPTKCAVGGHSYGSFMTAHLLSHTSLFAAGIGRSGAFNRTLTPMSFQSEDRSLWEAPDTYIEMSPLMHVKKYSEQNRVGKMLLIHGEVDENSGTHTMQSERYFAALKAFGIESRLCILPYERHSYRARESILHMAWEQEQWLGSLE